MHKSYDTTVTTRVPESNDSPFCPKCGSPLRLIRVEPVPGCEKHTLKCSRCEREETVLVTPPARDGL